MTEFTLTLSEELLETVKYALEIYRDEMQERWPNKPDAAADRASAVLEKIQAAQNGF